MNTRQARLAEEIRRRGQQPNFEKLWRAAMLVPRVLSEPPSFFPSGRHGGVDGWGIATMRSTIEPETHSNEHKGTEQRRYESVLGIDEGCVLFLYTHTVTHYGHGHALGEGTFDTYTVVDVEVSDFEGARVSVAEAFEELAQLVERGGAEEGGPYATVADQGQRAASDARHKEEQSKGIASMFDNQRQQIGAFVDTFIEAVLAAFRRGERSFFVHCDIARLEHAYPGISAGELLEDAIVADLSRRLQTGVQRDYAGVGEGGFYISFATPSGSARPDGGIRPWAPQSRPEPRQRGGGWRNLFGGSRH